jgi:hypothetical protein
MEKRITNLSQKNYAEEVLRTYDAWYCHLSSTVLWGWVDVVRGHDGHQRFYRFYSLRLLDISSIMVAELSLPRLFRMGRSD